MTSKPRILYLLGCYWPGNEATGPNQSFEALANTLGDEFDISVIAKATPGGPVGEWQTVGKVQRMLLPARKFGASGLRKILNTHTYDVLVLNGFHDREFTIPALVMRKFRLIPHKPTVLSPRGEFAGGALAIKSRAKQLYRKFADLFRLTKDIWLHATAIHEKADIERAGLEHRGILMAENARQIPEPLPVDDVRTGPVRLVFLGRVAPVKNLDFAISILRNVKCETRLDVYGPLVDTDYWASCESLIKTLPNHITVRHCGVLDHDTLGDTLPKFDAMFLPTKGENFGHAINEALSLNVPVLISDQTPWTGLEDANAGWDLPLSIPQAFVSAIETLAREPAQARLARRSDARKLAERSFQTSDAVAANRRLFETALGTAP